MGFSEDLKLGNKYEQKAVELFEHETYEIKKGKFKPYDIIFDNELKVEVKVDRLAYKTGNLAIEYACNGKPSGLSTTEAKYYIYYVIEEDKTEIVYKIETAKLRRLIKDCRTVRGGDGWRSQMYLVPCKKLIKYILTIN